MSEKPTWNYILNDLAFSALRDLVISGKANEQDIIDFKHQLKLKDEQYKKVCDISRKAIDYIEKLLEILKGDDKNESVEKE